MIKVSIVIPVYNQEKLITRALDSIPNRDDIEVIICDDCSTDNTYNILLSYKRLNLKLFRNDKNMGVGHSRNVCFDNCTGKYIFGLDSDDYLITDKWEYVVDNFLGNNYDYVRISREENNLSISTGGVAFHTYFMNRETLGSHRCEERDRGEDWFLFEEIHKDKKISEIHSGVVAYHYNYPNVGSITWTYENNRRNDK